MTLYAANGSINVTVVDGNTRTGLIAPDGSRYIVMADGSAPIGATHHCGAWNATHAPASGYVPIRAPDGSIYVSETRRDGALFVTVVSGSLGDAAPTPPFVSSVAITGVPEISEELTADVTATGDGVTLSYQWKRDGSNIGSATNDTYTVVSNDLNKYLTVTATGANDSGTHSRTSNAVQVEGSILSIDPTIITDVDVTLTIDTNLIKGQFFYVITESATPPTKTQILAGQDHTGAAAVAAGSTNVQHLEQVLEDAAAAALTAETDYWVYATQRNAKQSFNSNIAFIDFTTTAA